MKRSLGLLLVALLVGSAAAFAWMRVRIAPMPAGDVVLERFQSPTPLAEALEGLAARGVVRDASALRLYARFRGAPDPVRVGTYRTRPGMTADEVLAALRQPIRRMVRLPEGWWISRTARLLEERGVCKAEEYIDLAAQPAQFRDVVSFALPSDSLEGYLFPDTYDLPPLLGARETIVRQLRVFEQRVVKGLDIRENLHPIVIAASMIELEVAKPEERAIVAGVIDNRLRARMPLQIDATVLYALQEWKQLGPGVVRTVDSPYNTYLYAGLPPGPIGAPSLASIEAALKPARHEYLYYVALPDGSHVFSNTYDEHREGIRRRQRALREREAR
jgi:UPF0755 protein